MGDGGWGGVVFFPPFITSMMEVYSNLRLLLPYRTTTTTTTTTATITITRDLKPDNLLFTCQGPDAELKIIDFGLSRVMDSGDPLMMSRVGTPWCE